ncbi:Chitin deacetylase [Leucoagaricus sp. SymC.cos]|nr:Chitin deacetylase [Leucoagaricus sp. SymC.cos]
MPTAPGTPAAGGVTTTTSTSVTVVTPLLASGLTADVSGIPPLASITMGIPTQPTPSVSTTYTQGATGPVSGAPGLPTPFVFQMSDWPAQDQVPDTNSPEVQEWMKELEGFDIPDITPTTDGSCAGDVAAAAEAAQRGWWTCGGYTRDTDIVACPDKLTWGVSFDDGPGPYTQNLLDYLKAKDISATFFVVGSRVIERPKVLIEEYMAGHEVSVHTWSHRPLTSLTTEQVVAELGWTRKAIRNVIGVTPTTMRPPFGDIDNRIRAISLAMGLVPIMWTRTPSGGSFDTFDWRVAAGQVNGTQSFQTFQTILNNASNLDTGFIVLQHDVHEITVDLAIGYTLDSAINHQPPFTLKAIGECTKTPMTNMYLETTQNSTFPYPNRTNVDVDGDGKAETAKGAGEKNGAAFTQSSIFSVLLSTTLAASSSLLFF